MNNNDDGVAGGSFLNWHPSEYESDTQSSSWVDMLEYTMDTGPLYDGARITVVDSIGLLLGFCLEHNATNRVLSSLLEIIRLHMPKTSRTMGDRREHHLKSLYYLRKIFEFNQKNSFKKHYICGKCTTVCENIDVAVCECCKADVDKSEYFLTLDVASQLEELFKDQDILDAINAQKQCKHSSTGSMRDVYDGENYRKVVKSGFLRHPRNLTVTWNVCEAPLSNTPKSKVSIWPLQGYINELPPTMRFYKERVLIFGIWFGKQKPLMSSFMGPLVPVFNDLYKNGVQVRGNTFKLKLLSATMDVSAMSLVKNTEHHSGKHGCGLCEDESVSVPKRRGQTSVYLCHDGKSVKRTNVRMETQARKAFDMRDDVDASVKGVKGYSVLSFVKDVDLSNHMTVDYLHGTCLGVMKAMICLWIRDKQKPYYIGNRLVEINRKLKKIKPTEDITPGPRSLTNEISHLKASDFRSFLCYYGMMALKGILPDDYYVHFSMMSIGIHTLSKDDITAKDLAMADELLRKFYPLFEVYYGQENCTIHVHNMCRHLVDSVRRAGPVWAFGCFSFESNCVQMIKYIRGSTDVGMQVIKNYSLLQRARSLAEAASSGEVRSILLHGVLGEDCTRNPDGIFKYKRSYPSTFDIEELKKKLDCEDVTAMKITKTKPKEGGELLHSMEAIQSKLRVNYVVSYMDDIKKYGRISYFLKVVDREKDTLTLARIQPSVIISENAFKDGCESSWKEHGLKDRTGNHAKEIEFKGCDSVLIDVRDVVSKVLFMETGPDRGVVLPVACRWEQD